MLKTMVRRRVSAVCRMLLAHFIFPAAQDAGTAVLPILQRRRLRLRGVKWLEQGLPLVSGSAWVPAQVSVTPKPRTVNPGGLFQDAQQWPGLGPGPWAVGLEASVNKQAVCPPSSVLSITRPTVLNAINPGNEITDVKRCGEPRATPQHWFPRRLPLWGRRPVNRETRASLRTLS